AGAIASIAFGIAAPAVDGNVLRVLARLFRIREDVTSVIVRRRIVELAATLVSPDAPGSFNQSIMELGTTTCTPTSPACDRCPLENQCLARAAGDEHEIPITANRKKLRAVPVAFALIEANGRVLLVRRESGTLLGGLWALPGGEVPSRLSGRASLPMLVKKQTGSVIQVGPRWSPVDRTFSHRKWSGSIYRCSPTRHPSSGERVRWIPIAEALQLPLVGFRLKSYQPDIRSNASLIRQTLVETSRVEHEFSPGVYGSIATFPEALDRLGPTFVALREGGKDIRQAALPADATFVLSD